MFGDTQSTVTTAWAPTLTPSNFTVDYGTKQSNALLYVGLGLGALVTVGFLYLVTRDL